MENSRRRIYLDLCFLLWIAVVLVGHIFTLNEPFVNQEYAFSEAGQTLAHPAYADGIQRYWAVQANPLGYSIIVAGLLKAFNAAPSFWLVRLPSLFGVVLILTAGWLFYRNTRDPDAHSFNIWAAVTMLNPLCWIYAGQATADILPTGLICIAFAVCAGARGRILWHLMGGVLFSIAVIVKFNTALCGLGFAYLIFSDNNDTPSSSLLNKASSLLFYVFLPVTTLGVYFYWINSTFQVYLLAAPFRKLLAPSRFAAQFFEIAIMYLSYLTTLLGFLALAPLLNLFQSFSRKRAVTITLITILLSGIIAPVIISFHLGEMDYGGFNHLLPSGLFAMMRASTLALSILFFIDIFQKALFQKNRLAAFVLSAILPYIIISSFFRPAQRYLLLILPMVFFYITIYSPPKLRRINSWLIHSSIVVFAIISFIGVAYIISEGRAADNMALWIKHENYLSKTNPDAIAAHAGQYFPVSQEDSLSFKVQTEAPASYLHKEAVSVFGKNVRTYYFCEMINCGNDGTSSYQR
jgi:hypothetical protein